MFLNYTIRVEVADEPGSQHVCLDTWHAINGYTPIRLKKIGNPTGGMRRGCAPVNDVHKGLPLRSEEYKATLPVWVSASLQDIVDSESSIDCRQLILIDLEYSPTATHVL